DTLRLYVFKPSAVTIGYFMSLRDSVNLPYVQKEGIPVVRRISGGGSVLHDELGEITYSIIVKSNEVPRDPVESFKFLSGGVIEAAKILGAPAEFKPLNDGIIAQKKFSGNAQARKLGAILQHGTFMYASDLNKLGKALRAPKEKLKAHEITRISERVTTISRYLGRKVSREEALNALKEGFRKWLKVELVEGSYTPEEIELAKSLRWKYLSKQWNELRP
ncbi:MAG: lipoate--protein ligase family protein, partial [Desulfurococcales archaeon]|nr:lipoate--protein ligase family protein [Desulfurococcales archaeon]